MTGRTTTNAFEVLNQHQQEVFDKWKRYDLAGTILAIFGLLLTVGSYEQDVIDFNVVSTEMCTDFSE